MCSNENGRTGAVAGTAAAADGEGAALATLASRHAPSWIQRYIVDLGAIRVVLDAVSRLETKVI